MDLDKRMKDYEYVTRAYLTRRMPIIIRVDGRAFHAVTRTLEKPFSDCLIAAMVDAGTKLCETVQGAKMAYVQSDEISVFASAYDTVDTEPWFGGNIQKITSIAAAMVTLALHCSSPLHLEGVFDARVFVLPKEEVTNYFIWRQQDWTRNSIQMLARAHFSHQQVHRLNTNQLHEKLFSEKGINWANLVTHLKNGIAIRQQDTRGTAETSEGVIEVERHVWQPDWETPVFTQYREYIEDLV